jgi:hypothetical protein
LLVDFNPYAAILRDKFEVAISVALKVPDPIAMCLELVLVNHEEETAIGIVEARIHPQLHLSEPHSEQTLPAPRAEQALHIFEPQVFTNPHFEIIAEELE